MNPSPSMILFTACSGLGYGMLAILALGAVAGLLPTTPWLGLAGLGLALASVTLGLLSSLSRLRQPKRAWMVLTQTRSSWLSRESMAALITYVPALLLACSWVFLGTVSGIFSLFALATVVGAIATVYCSGMKFASLPPIQAWHHPMTTPIYLGFALMTGALATQLLVALFGLPNGVIGILALLATSLAFGLKLAIWRQHSAESPATTIKSATGLRDFGPVRALDPPRTQTNYLLREMGFEIGRKHARRLRILAIFFGLFGSSLMTLLALILDGWLIPLTALLALAFGMVGVILERWLFFAEAKHTSMLFYGGDAEIETTEKSRHAKRATIAIGRQRRPTSTSIAGKPLSR